MGIFKRIQYILIYVCGFILIGVTSLISSDVGWRGFHDWKFYVDTGLTYMAIICIIVATLLKIIDEIKLKDKEYIEADKAIKDFATKTYRPSLFSKFCDHTNKKRKLKQYVHNIKRKIYELENKASEEDLHIWVNGTKEDKDKNEYCKKRLNLEKQLTDDYIKSLENYMNNENPKIRLIGTKEVLERFKEDENRKDNPSLMALLNKSIFLESTNPSGKGTPL